MEEILIKEITLPKPPVYDYKESVIEYSRKFEDYMQMLIKVKYDAILKFLNIWLNHYKINLKKLTDFKFINIDKITKDKKYNNKILRYYSDKLNDYFNIKKESYINIDSEDIDEDEIIIFIKKLLNKIDYTVIKKYKDDDVYYSILNKKTKD